MFSQTSLLLHYSNFEGEKKMGQLTPAILTDHVKHFTTQQTHFRAMDMHMGLPLPYTDYVFKWISIRNILV